MEDRLDFKKELEEKSRVIGELQSELEKTNQGILLLSLEFEQAEEERNRHHRQAIESLQNKARDYQSVIENLQSELEETNRGILLLTLELEEEKDSGEQSRLEIIEQLENELEATNKGLLALTCELEQAKEKFHNIVECANGAIFTISDGFIVETANPAATRLFGYSEAELVGTPINRLFPKLDSVIEKSIKDDSEGFLIFHGKKKNGSIFPVELTFGGSQLHDRQSWIVIAADLTYRIKIEQGLKLMARVFDESYDAIIITDIAGTIVDVNASFTTITGYAKQEVLGQNPRMLKSDHHDLSFYQAMWQSIRKEGRWCGEVWDKRKNGEIYPKWLSISAVKDEEGQICNYVGIFTDMTARIETENKLRILAHFDQLTGLPNRTLFVEKLKWAIDLSDRSGQDTVLFFLDLDRFKIINDTLGHQAGDRLLCEVAKRLQKCIRKVDTVARLAGDEFTIILTNVKEKGTVKKIAQKVLDSFAAPILLENREIYVTTSIGITRYPADGGDIDILLKNADTAMYHAKAAGKNRFEFYSGYMVQQVQDELDLELDLRKALENAEFLLYFQPLIDLGSGRLVGMEALIRWDHPQRGFISPMKFIPYAEKTDLILPIGAWVLERACQYLVNWQAEGWPPLKLSVNYSGRQLKQPNQHKIVKDILHKTGVDPAYLNIELTESVIMEDAESSTQALQALKSIGLSISVDDFGTGYSSLSYLKRFPIDNLKIDRSFIRDITVDPDDEAIVSSIIAMAHALRLSVVAEGVETEQQLTMLREKRCDQAQGFYFCPPVSAEEVQHFIHTFQPIESSLSAADPA
ncbi:MAG: EAL domain-containing protein [Methylococcaceae bacterium]|nr:MAG: EAL domain-containing protein [Methylococcaceae bacterium]